MAALQSSLLLGLLHGVNPCGHSWLVIAPFVSGETRGRRIALLTGSFLLGTALACLLLGATLGTISSFLPPSASYWVSLGTSIILIILGLLLMYKPTLLHSHTQKDEHDHQHKGASSCSCSSHHNKKGIAATLTKLTGRNKAIAPALFLIGFFNMIIPCPTAAIMYGFALKSASPVAATLVFSAYAFTTAIAVSAVIFLLFRVTKAAKSLQKEWVEPLIMRSAGLVIVIFSTYELLHGVNP